MSASLFLNLSLSDLILSDQTPLKISRGMFSQPNEKNCEDGEIIVCLNSTREVHNTEDGQIRALTQLHKTF